EHMQQLSIEQAWKQMSTVSKDENIDLIINHNVSLYIETESFETSCETIKTELKILTEACSDYQAIIKAIAL
ncbi:MAG: hypothetical protein KAU21_05370, partial [Gammaproteobacteria bacterium]|nr:hypothetical protein [Gammaproteobacteria bacterium]